MNTWGNLPVKALDTKHREAQEQTDQGDSFQKMMWCDQNQLLFI